MTPVAKKYSQEELDEIVEKAVGRAVSVAKEAAARKSLWVQLMPSLLTIAGFFASIFVGNALLGVRVTRVEQDVSTITSSYSTNRTVEQYHNETQAEFGELNERLRRIEDKLDERGQPSR